MLKLLLGNAVFAICIGGWYLYCDGERALMLAGVLLAFPCFISGIFMGYILRVPSTPAGQWRDRERFTPMAEIHADPLEQQGEAEVLDEPVEIATAPANEWIENDLEPAVTVAPAGVSHAPSAEVSADSHYPQSHPALMPQLPNNAAPPDHPVV